MTALDPRALEAALEAYLGTVASNISDAEFDRLSVSAAITAYLDALWRPIEEMEDGSKAVVYNPFVGVYSTERQGGEFPLGHWGHFGRWFPQPTHFQPVPQPPKDSP